MKKLLKNDMLLFAVVIIMVVIGAAIVLHQRKSPTITPAPNTTQNINDSTLAKLTQSFPGITWGEPESINQSTGAYGEFPGRKVTGTITVSQPSVPQSGDKDYLMSLGYEPDPGMAADGPGSSVWGYSKNEKGVTSVVIFSFEAKPTNSNPNEPVQFNCPCDATVSIFISDMPLAAVSGNKTSLANPASVNCSEKGGTTSIQKGPNGQYGLCEFADNQACEEWAMYRGDCPVGGVKTTGYDNTEQMYCAWVGGRTLAEPDANCTLPGGKICSNSELYNGTCDV